MDVTFCDENGKWKCIKCGACCRSKYGAIVLPEFWENGKCKYLKDNECSIYETRPEICRVKPNADNQALIDACKLLYDGEKTCY